MSAASEINGFNCKMEDEDIFYSDEEFSDTEDSEMRSSEVNGYHTSPSEDQTSKTVYFQFFSSSEIIEEAKFNVFVFSQRSTQCHQARTW